MLKEKSIVILHDTFLYKGGGEKLMIMMQKVLKCDIATGFVSKGSFDLKKEGVSKKIIEISSEIFKSGFRHIKLKWAFLFKTKFLKNYDTVIFSGDCLSAVRNCNKNSKKIYYCHTPPRYLYDLKNQYLKKVKWYIKPIFILVSSIFRKIYENDIKKMDIIIVNSKNTGKRLKRFLGYDSQIIYPPVKIGEFKYIGQKDYYLSFARLCDAKRVGNIVKAFREMPEKKLVVIYGQNDPQKNEIFNLGKGFSNIEFRTLVENDRFINYIGNCIATIYIPVDEDFGMSPVESMSAGKPVLGVNDGGLKESIIHKKTGFLIDKQGKIDDIIDVVQNFLTPDKCLKMRKDCEERAKDFSYDKFEKLINKII